MKAAIVGCGGIAAVHAASISQLQGAVLTAFADIKKERAEDFASRYGGKAYGSLEEMLEQGYEQVDFVYVNGDAYVDHPSFGCAIITRVLQAYGYSCAIFTQPDWP